MTGRPPGQATLPARRGTTLLAASLAVGLAGPSTAQNFPPNAVIDSDPPPARPGVPFQLLGSGSSDPDGGPEALAYSWDFGDGEVSSEVDPQHAFTERGLYTVSLRVFDGVAASIATLEVPVLEAPSGPAPVHSSPLALSPDGTRLWVANRDASSVSLVDTGIASGSREWLDEVGVAAGPVSLAASRDGSRVHVACREAGRLVTIDAAGPSVIADAPLGRTPAALVRVPGTDLLLVTLEGEGALLVLDPADAAAARRIELGGRPRAVAVTGDGEKAVVTDFLAGAGDGRAWSVDLVTETVDAEVALGPDPSLDSSSSGRGLPNLLSSVVIEPSGRLAWIGGLKSNVFRGLIRDGQPLRPTNRVRGLVAPLELGSGLERADWRIDLNDADTGRALAILPDGRHALVAHQGTGELSVYDLLEPTRIDTFDGSAIPFVARIGVGEAPQGVLVQQAGGRTRAWVLAALSRELVVVDVSDPAAPVVEERLTVATETLDPVLLRGKRAFFRSSRPRHSSEGYVACASCHPDGSHDGRTWDFTDGGEGLRNTIDLRGRAGTGHGPVHWSANFDEIQDFENDIVFAFGGTGLAEDGEPPSPPLGAPNAGRGADLDALAAWVSSLDAVPESPFRAADGTLTDAARRGKALFYSTRTRCSACHVPPRFTDSTLAADPAAFRLHDVGTIRFESGARLGAELEGLDTPTLKLLWDGAPYLHDGRAETLREVLVDWNPADRHGRTSDLSGPELDDLVAFLRSIDDRPDVLPEPATEPPGEASPVGAVPLRVQKSGTWLHLSWDLAPNAETHVVSRGALGDFGVHRAGDGAGSCDTGGEVQLFDPDDLTDGGDWFYLVAGRNDLGEGPVGPGRAARTPSASCP